MVRLIGSSPDVYKSWRRVQRLAELVGVAQEPGLRERRTEARCAPAAVSRARAETDHAHPHAAPTPAGRGSSADSVLTKSLECALLRGNWDTAHEIALLLPLRAHPAAVAARDTRPAWELCVDLTAALAGHATQPEMAARTLAMLPADAMSRHAPSLLARYADAAAVEWLHKHEGVTPTASAFRL